MITDPYNALVREAFANTPHAGSLSDTVCVSKSDQGVRIELSASSKDGVVRELRFRAWGCPHVIAAAETACAELEGQAGSELENYGATDLMQRLAVPAEKSGRIIVLEDTVRLLGKALREASLPEEQN